MDKQIIVLAGSREQFERYLDDNGLTDSEAVYGWSPERILSVRANKVVEIGTFYEKPDAYELRELANSILYYYDQTTIHKLNR